jgi:hypothetical protein
MYVSSLIFRLQLCAQPSTLCVMFVQRLVLVHVLKSNLHAVCDVCLVCELGQLVLDNCRALKNSFCKTTTDFSNAGT